MNAIARLSLKWRFMLVVAVPLIAIVGLTLSALSALSAFSDIHRGVNSIYNDRVVPLEDLKNISDDYAVFVIDAVNKVNAGLISPDEAARQLEYSRRDIGNLWNEYTATRLTEREADLVAEAEQLFDRADRAIDKAIERLRRMEGSAQGQLDDLDGPLYEVVDPVTEKVGELVSLQLDAASRERDKVEALYQKTRWLYPLVATLVSLLVLAVSLIIVLSVTRPVQAMRTTMLRVVESSDLSLRIQTSGNDEIAQLGNAFNQMLATFDRVIAHLSSVSDQVATASEELSSISADTLNNVQEQAEQTDQVAAAMNQMTAASGDVARSADESQSAARHAAGLGESGRSIGEQGVRHW